MNNGNGNSRSGVASEKQTEVAVLAAGCFWGVEEILPERARRVGHRSRLHRGLA